MPKGALIIVAAVCIVGCEELRNFLFLHSLSDCKSDGVFFFIYVITCTCGRKRKAIESAAERGAERDQAAFHGAVLGWGQS